MANRYMLHISKLEDFKDWLVKDGWEIEQPKGTYEVLRARKSGRKNPLIVYTKADAKEHLSLMDRDSGVVGAFLRDCKNTKTNSDICCESMEHDGCKGCKYEHCSPESKECQGCKQNAVDKYTRMTQFDRIKSMSMEELAALITSGEMCAICPFCEYYGTKDCYIENEGKHKNCDKGIMNWLQSEVEE